MYISQCEFEEARAVALVEKYAALHPDAPRWVNALGLVQVLRPERRHLDEGIKVFKKAIANGVEDPFIYANLVYALAEKGEYDESRQMGERSTQIWRESGVTLSSADFHDGYRRYVKGEYAKADAVLRRFHATRPMREEREFLIFAGTQAGLKRYDEAIKVYNDGLARLPKSCQLWEGFGSMYAVKGDIPNALATFDKGINAIPKCGLNYNSAASLLIKQNRIPEAKQKLHTLIKLAPSSDGAVIAKEILASIGMKS
jgi:tetratricopeptide (TPR) repeat protein